MHTQQNGPKHQAPKIVTREDFTGEIFLSITNATRYNKLDL